MNTANVWMGRNLALIVQAVAMVASAAGCPSTGASDPAAQGASQQVEANFDLSKCQEQGPEIYKCPALDKPVCIQAFSQPSVQCIRIGKKATCMS
jgi:hypothetical protein